MLRQYFIYLVALLRQAHLLSRAGTACGALLTLLGIGWFLGTGSVYSFPPLATFVVGLVVTAYSVISILTVHAHGLEEKLQPKLDILFDDFSFYNVDSHNVDNMRKVLYCFLKNTSGSELKKCQLKLTHIAADGCQDQEMNAYLCEPTDISPGDKKHCELVGFRIKQANEPISIRCWQLQGNLWSVQPAPHFMPDKNWKLHVQALSADCQPKDGVFSLFHEGGTWRVVLNAQ